MDKQNYEKVILFFKNKFDIDVHDILLKNDSRNVLDNISSYTFISLVVELEQEFNIQFDFTMLNIEAYGSFENFLEYVVCLIDNRSGEKVKCLAEYDLELGCLDKQYAHRHNVRHLAYSVVIFDTSGRMLIQKRNMYKYHSGGLWSNACCSHPITDDIIYEASERLFFEMGIKARIQHEFDISYQIQLDHEMYENELDKVYIGTCDCEPKINHNEVDTYRWIDFRQLCMDIENNPQEYTYWFKLIVQELIKRK